MTIDEALAVIEKLKPRRAYLTHMSHEVDHDVYKQVIAAARQARLRWTGSHCVTALKSFWKTEESEERTVSYGKEPNTGEKEPNPRVAANTADLQFASIRWEAQSFNAHIARACISPTFIALSSPLHFCIGQAVIRSPSCSGHRSADRPPMPKRRTNRGHDRTISRTTIAKAAWRFSSGVGRQPHGCALPNR